MLIAFYDLLPLPLPSWFITTTTPLLWFINLLSCGFKANCLHLFMDFVNNCTHTQRHRDEHLLARVLFRSRF